MECKRTFLPYPISEIIQFRFIHPLTGPIVGMRAWGLPQRSFSIWEGYEQHSIIPVALDPSTIDCCPCTFFVVFLAFCRLSSCLVVFLWQVCFVYLYDQNHWNFRRFTVAKSGSCGPAASVMACVTDIFVMWSL